MSKLNLNFGQRKSQAVATTNPTAGHNTETIKGSGRKDFPFQSVEDIVKGAIKRAKPATKRSRKKTAQTSTNAGQTSASQPVDSGKEKLVKSLDSANIDPSQLAELIKVNKVVPVGETRETYEDGRVMLEGADGLQALMISRQFDALYDSRFGRLRNSVDKARTTMPAKYQPVVSSLESQLTKLEASYRKALPQVIEGIGKQNPGAPVHAVVQKAIEVLDQELAKIIYILRVYTDCFDQMGGDGEFAKLLWAITFFFEQTHQLYWGGDLEGSGNPTALKSGEEHVGDVFLGRLTGSGLATIPGARGPVGAHAVQVPFDMQDIIPINLPLFGHEARHNVYHDVFCDTISLEDEQVANLGQAILKAAKDGTIKFVSPTIKVGKQNLPTEQLMAKLATDCIGEIDADYVGGVLFNGRAFGENMVMSFPAMMVRDGRVSEKRNLLRLESHFELVPQKDGSTALEFEPHPVDYVRVHFVAAALDEIGFADDAKKLRQLADFAVGDELPTKVTYRNSDPKSKLTIEIPVADIIAVAPVVAKVLIRTPLKSQNGKSCGDLVMWTQKRQDKVDILTDILVADKADVPTDKGHFFAPYVGAAATLAYLKLVREKKMEASKAALMVSKNAFTMLETLRQRAAAK